MKACVFGAGAVGSFVAATLHRAGQQVSLVVRGENLRAIKANGLRVTCRDEVTEFRPACSDAPADLGVQDVVFVTAKATALPQVATSIAPLLGPATPVVFVVNGIPWWYFHGVGGEMEGRQFARLDPGGLAWTHIGPQRAIGGVINAPCTVIEPGVVEVGKVAAKYALAMGEPQGEITQRLRDIVASFGDNTLRANASTDIRRDIWAKLAMNLASGPFGAITGARLMDTFAPEPVAEARRRVQREAMAIAKAMGFELDLDVEAMLASARKSDHRVSIAQDVLQRRPVELDAMCIVPLEIARMKGVPTPTLDLLVDLARLRAVEDGLYPP